MRARLIPFLVTLPQALMTIFSAAGVYALVRAMRTGRDNDGLLIGLVAVALWTLASLIAAAGLWKRRNWARWLAVVLSMPIALLIFSEWLFEDDVLETDDWVVMACFFAVGLFYALPFTGRLLRRPSPH